MSAMCEKIHKMLGGKDRIGFPLNRHVIPANGIYVLFENGERGHGGDRIVRIGTHRGADNLWSRLKEHFLVENKDRSIFRKNIGRAILNRDGDPFLHEWELDLTSSESRDRHLGRVNVKKKAATEQCVTEYIRNHFRFTIIPMGRDKEERLAIEEHLISTISLCEDCGASPDWLGRYSPVGKIRESGLWNVQGLRKTPVNESDWKFLRRCCSA